MNEINIKTWNINWFRGLKSGDKYDSTDQNEDCYKDIIITIKSFLINNNNSVAILQEVPFKEKNVNGEWDENIYHKKLIEDFPKEEYEIISNVENNDYVLRRIIAIYRKNDYKKTQIHRLCNNRIIGLSNGSIIIIGVHMPTKFEKESNDEKMWDDLLTYVRECGKDNKKLILIGDFNAYVGCNNKLTEEKFIQLSRIMNDIVSDDTHTFIGNTAIDHLFVNYDTHQLYNIKIQNEFKCSDHKYIEVRINY